MVVNHFKSKGSGCLEDWLSFEESKDPADMQGKCNEFRVSAATVLGEAVKQIEGDVLVIGDLNAYGMEDPLLVLTDYDAKHSQRDIVTASHTTLGANTFEEQGRIIDKGYGLINLNTKFHGQGTYSYSYNGELGNLDHALGNTSVAARVIAVEDWHINASESNLFEYGTKYTGDLVKSENAFSASDHDPVIIALEYPDSSDDGSSGGSLGIFSLVLLGLLGFRRGSKNNSHS